MDAACFSRLQLDGAVGAVFVVLCALLCLTVWTWRQDSDAGQGPFRLAHLAMVWWLATMLMEMAATPLNCKMAWSALNYPGISLLVISWSLFVVDYGPGAPDWTLRWRPVVYTVVPGFALVAALTNDWLHGIYLPSSSIEIIDGRLSPDWDHGPLFYVLAVHHYIWVAAAITASVVGYRIARQDFKALFGGLFCITVLPVATNLAYLFLEVTVFGSDPTPFAFALTLCAYGWMLLNNRTLGVENVGQRNIFHSSPVPIVILDKEGERASVNATAGDLLDGPRAAEFQEGLDTIAAMLLERGRLPHEWTLAIGDRLYSPKLLIVSDPINAQRPLLGWSITFLDITREEQTARSLREAKEHAEEASRLQAEFLSIVSHELRTPLTSIRATVDLIGSGKLGEVPRGMARAMEIAKRNSQRLALLIDDLLDLQKLEAGQMEMEFRITDLGSVVQGCLEDMDSYCETEQVRIDFRRPPETLIAMTDPARLSQVILNVAANAVKFSPAGAVVEVVLEQAGGSAQIRVIDRGPGIPEGAEGKVFGRFEQVDQSATRSQGGTGLGMSISRLMLAQLGGEIFYESTYGDGTTFFVRLPLATSEDQATLRIGTQAAFA